MDINEARAQIEIIDKEMAVLFEKRMACSKAIAEYKMANNMPIFDAVREQQLIEKNSAYLENSDMKEYYKDYLLGVMGVSKNYQKAIIGK